MAKPLFILQGNGRMTNRGCEAILRGTVSILQQEFGPCRFVNAPPGPIEDDRLDDLEAEIDFLMPRRRARWSPQWFAYQFRKRLLRRLPHVFERHLPAATATLALAGDNFSLEYGVPVGFFEANRATLRRNKPLVLWGASVGPFSARPDFERFAARELKRATLICARESETVAYLDGLGVRDNVRLTADPAFVLEPKPVAELPPELQRPEGSCVGINLSPLLDRFCTGEQPWPARAAACVRAVIERVHAPVLLVPHEFSRHSDDHAFLQQVLALLEDVSDRVALVGRQYSAAQLKWIISRLALFVGARTHSTIAALSTNVPTISIAYSIKARGINKDIFGHLDWLIPGEQLAPEPLAERVATLFGKREAVRAHLVDMMPAYKQRALDAAKYVRDVVVEHLPRSTC